MSRQTTADTAINGPRPIIRLPEVKRMTGLGRSTIYASPTFPKPIPLGPRAVGWLEDEVQAWQRQCIAERDRKGRAA